MRLFLLGIAYLMPSLAFADVDLASRVDGVVVFPDAAVVTRVAQLDLQAGASTLVLRGLPAAIDPASLRVTGEGRSPFTIAAIDVRTVPGGERPRTRQQPRNSEPEVWARRDRLMRTREWNSRAVSVPSRST